VEYLGCSVIHLNGKSTLKLPLWPSQKFAGGLIQAQFFGGAVQLLLSDAKWIQI
jgi:hypothetical protein